MRVSSFTVQRSASSRMLSARFCGFRVRSLLCAGALMSLLDRALASLDGYVPGMDYPAFEEVPKGLSFTCSDKIPGYYADPETQCQVWHWCVAGIGGNVKYSFICTAGTVFNQATRVCDWFFNFFNVSIPCITCSINHTARVCDWSFNVDCQGSPNLYGINEDLYKDFNGNYIAGKKK